jgi:predicted ATPase/DNA-binding SARP family transcriptional activator
MTRSAGTPKFRVSLFGVPSLEWNGAAVSIAARPSCAVLLAMILLAEPDRRLFRKAVAAELWPDDDESTAAANLRRHLSFLVTALPAADECIGRDREALWCRASVAPWCDVVEFKRGALDLYNGDFMEGSAHDWVLAQRERLRSDAVEGWLDRAETQREEDDFENAIASARRATQIDPFNESVAQLEITLHGERGDIPALELAFTGLERRLREIDAKALPETVALVDRFHSLAREAAARIPRPMTLFVEPKRLEDVARLVPAHRLVTIVGPGGAGKTRLALEVAHRLATTFPDGAYFADLSTVVEGDALSDALARALGVPTDLASKGFAGVKTLLRNRRALLLLDNCEQVTESCSWFLNDLLETAPYVHVVVTTREAFGLRAERCYALSPLSPADAVRLFVDRARSVAWDGHEVAGASARIAAICERLDRLPLALELAASMLGALPLADLERHLEEGVDQLRSRDPTTPARHRSLLDVIGWSVSLLDAGERDAFTRLAVFAGSFSAEAAKAVCAVDLATLAKLIAKSVLLRADAVESRFVFLNSIGEFARRLFDADPQAAALRDAHAAHFSGVAMRSEDLTFWRTEREWLREIERDFPNSAQALNWSLFEGGFAQNGARLAIGLTHYFTRRGFLADGVSWLGAAIERTTSASVERAQLMYRLANLEIRAGRFEIGYEHARAARASLSDSGLDRELARALDLEANSLLFLGRDAEAKQLLERALPLAQRCGDLRTQGWILSHTGYILARSEPSASRDCFVQAQRRFHEAGVESDAARALGSIAASDYIAGRYDVAKENIERALAIHRDLDDAVGAAGAANDLGDVAFMEGSTALARDYYAEALAFCEDRDTVLSYPTLLTGIAGLAVEGGRPRDAARLIGAARWQDDGTQTPARVRVLERARTRAEQLLGKDECAREIAFGRDLSRKDAGRLARSVLDVDATKRDERAGDRESGPGNIA